MPTDDLTLTIRVHDPLEKQDAAKSASWAVVKVSRADVTMPLADFIAKYVQPAFGQISNLNLGIKETAK
jgi:hypothetical protein